MVLNQTTKKKMTAAELLGAARFLLSTKLPHMRRVLVSTVMRESTVIETFAMSKTGIMLYNPEFAESLNSIEECAAVVYHELLHFLLRHWERTPRTPEGVTDTSFHKLCNIGFDLAIYSIVMELFSMPLGSFRPVDFGWPAGQTSEFYIAKLLKNQDGINNAPPGTGGKGGSGQGQGDEDGSGAGATEGQQSAKVGQGGCGGAAGNPTPGEPEDDDEDARTPAQTERIRAEFAHAHQEHTRGQGAGSAEMQRFCAEVLEPARIPWAVKFRRAVTQAATYRPGAQVYMFDGPSRRQAGVGYGVGRPVVPRLRAPVARVACVVDTSASMSRDDMTAAVREVAGVMAAVRADIQFVAIDRKVHSSAKVRRVEDIIPLLKGGGGTDFRPAFAALKEQATRPDVVVFITDGDGPAPVEQPNWCRTIWVLVGKYPCKPCAWGECIEVQE